MWATHQVSEDFEIMMRMAGKGYVGIYAAYPDLSFGEGVTRKFDEEAGKQLKFSFGAVNLAFHPIGSWRKEGIFQIAFKDYIHSKVIPWYSKLNVLIYLGSFVVTAFIFVLCIGQILLIPFGVYQQIFARFSLAILVETNLIYSVIQPLSFLVLAWKLSKLQEFQREIPSWRAELKEEAVSGLFLFTFFNGIMRETFQGVSHYLLGIRTSFGATPMNKLQEASIGGVARETLRRFGFRVIASVISLSFILWGYTHLDRKFFWNTLTAPFILSLGHLIAPFLLNPLFMNKLLGRPASRNPGDPVQVLRQWMAGRQRRPTSFHQPIKLLGEEA